MRFALGVVAGIAAAWAALAIWQRVPEFPDIDDEPLAAAPTIDPDWAERRRGDRRPGYEDSVTGWQAPHQGYTFGDGSSVRP